LPFVRSVLIVLSLNSIIACSEHKPLTESEIRFKKATAEQQAIIEKANTLLNEKLTGSLGEDVQTLIYAQEQLYYAEQVLKTAKIVGISSTA